MQRIWVLVLVVIVVAAISAVVWAQQEGTGVAPPGGDGMMGMGGWGMGGGAAIAVSATNDVYVVHGGMIVKYDRDLNLLKQAELPSPGGMMRGGGRMGRGGMGRRGGGRGRAM